MEVSNAMHRWIPAAALLLGASLPLSAQRIDRVEPGQGVPDAATRVVLQGEGFDPRARVDLHDGGPYEIARLSLAGSTPAIQVIGDRAYVSFVRGSEKRGGIYVIDVSDPTDPILLGEYGQSDGTQGYGVAVEGETAFVGFLNIYTFDGGIYVVDLDDETDPRLTNTYWDVRLPISIRCRGDRLYVADLTGGLVIVDVSDPADPQTLSSLPTGGLTWDVAVDGATAYLADGAAGLSIIDIADPASPVLRSRIAPVAAPGPFDDGTLGVAVRGDLAYLADSRPGFAGLTIVDVRDPDAPRVVGQHETPNGARSVEVHGDTAYVTDGVGGLQVVDVSDPAAPRYLGGAIATAFSGDFDDFDVKDGFAFVADQQFGLRVIDVRTPTAPTAVSRTPLAGASGIERRGDLAFIVDAGGLKTLDLADPSDPRAIGALAIEGGGAAVALSDDLAAVAGTGGLSLVSVANPSLPKALGSYPMSNAAIAIELDGSMAAVVDGEAAFFVDIGDPALPNPLGRCDSRDRSCRIRNARGIALANGHAFIAADFEGLHVVDLANPAAPRRVATERTPHRATDVLIDGDLAYVAIGSLGIAVYDVSTPGEPQRLAGAATRGFAQGLSLEGSVLTVANGFHGVEVFDVSDPTAPHRLERIDTAGEALDSAAAGDHVWIADRVYGLWVARRNPEPVIDRVEPERVEMTVPAGYQAGPYNVVATNPDGGSGTLNNGFRVCPERDFSVELVPHVEPASGVLWSIELAGDPALVGDPGAHDAWLELPPAAAADRVEFLRGSLPGTTIDLWDPVGGGEAFVLLTGADEAAARATWADLVASGRVPLPERGPSSYGPIRLSKAGRRASNADILLNGLASGGGFDPSTLAGAERRHTRLRVHDGVLVSASIAGRGSDLIFRARAGDAEACGASASTSAVRSISAFCRSLADAAPGIRFECPVGDSSLPIAERGRFRVLP